MGDIVTNLGTAPCVSPVKVTGEEVVAGRLDEEGTEGVLV
jgi:hypothetical protein